MQFNPHHYPYPSRRTMVYGSRGMVATGHPLATASGLKMLQQGGSAADAVLAMATSLTVVEPCCNGIGGDGFGIIHDGKTIKGLNASGQSPASLSAEALRSAGHKKMPLHGWAPVNVPGLVGGWMALWQEYGKLPLEQVMEPAVDFARHGAIVQPQTAVNWAEDWRLKEPWLKKELHRPFAQLFSKNGRPYEAGDLFQSEAMAKTLELIAETRGESFYRGVLAEKMDAFARQTGGYLRGEDLDAYQPLWVNPMSVEYHGYEIWELPPNGHGITVLMTLAMLKELDRGQISEDLAIHQQIEAMKLAFADALCHITDPEKMLVEAESLLDPEYIRHRVSLIEDFAKLPEPGAPESHGTVYMAAADDTGLMVSWIQSNYTNFGSGIVVPETGISLHNRGCNFSLEPGHANEVCGGKRPYHTIIPGFITKNGEPLGPFGVMGAFMQPQGHVQMALHLIDEQLNPQAALDAPRWQWMGGKKVELERECGVALAQALADRGHEVVFCERNHHMGRGQIILRTTHGYGGGTEPRTDGCVLGW